MKLVVAFIMGWIACIAVAGIRNRANGTPIEVYTKSGKRIR